MSFSAEAKIDLQEAAQLVPGTCRGKTIHVTTSARWVMRGVVGPTGERIRLEALKLGNRWLTSREALERFSLRLTPDFSDSQARISRSASARKKAERVLNSQGL